ncbi:hypothetical protein TNCV_3062661 [Trichonephila clavipes]|nr:hypothetical protein TNCV_3062661 [Trichonephila clavipes]
MVSRIDMMPDHIRMPDDALIFLTSPRHVPTADRDRNLFHSAIRSFLFTRCDATTLQTLNGAWVNGTHTVNAHSFFNSWEIRAAEPI